MQNPSYQAHGFAVDISAEWGQFADHCCARIMCGPLQHCTTNMLKSYGSCRSKNWGARQSRQQYPIGIFPPPNAPFSCRNHEPDNCILLLNKSLSSNSLSSSKLLVSLKGVYKVRKRRRHASRVLPKCAPSHCRLDKVAFHVLFHVHSFNLHPILTLAVCTGA